MDLKIPLPVPALPQSQTKAAANPEDQTRRKKHEDGLVGLVNSGNSCYMNATLQALSNCPPLRQYFLECHHPMSSSGQAFSTQRASDCLTVLFKKMWASERPPGHLSSRLVSSSMKQKMFRGSLQQDAQEFLRCLLTQIHDEISVQVPPSPEGVACGSCDSTSCCHRDSMVSCDSDCSSSSGDSNTKLVGSVRNSPLSKKKSSRQKIAGSIPNSVQGSPAIQPKFSLRGSYTKFRSVKGSTESLELRKLSPKHTSVSQQSIQSETLQEPDEPALKWAEDDVFVVDMTTRKVTVHHNCSLKTSRQPSDSTGKTTRQPSDSTGDSDRTDKDGVKNSSETEGPERLTDTPSEVVTDVPTSTDQGREGGKMDDGDIQQEGEGASQQPATQDTGKKEGAIQQPATPDTGKKEGASQQPATQDTGKTESQHPTTQGTEEGKTSPQRQTPVTPRNKKKNGKPLVRSIVNEVFEGTLESRVKCLACKKVSVTREPFQDLSLPIPGRKEMAKYNQKAEGGEGEKLEVANKGALSRGFCSVWNLVTALTRDFFVGPPTDLNDCLNAFFDTSELKGDNRYYCSHCKSFQNSLKEMSIVKLPEVLCIHLKRFRFDAYFSTKISRHIAFPLTSLDMSQYLKEGASKCSNGQYELNAVITHYGGAGGGHYVAFAKNGPSPSWYEFNDTHVHPVTADTVVGAEGYVLFYRKVASSDSQALRLLDVTTLVPRPGTKVPSPDVCYISRHWLHLLRHCADPGPIFQYEYACKHGAVLPARSEDVRSLSLVIRREVWDSFEQRHGGGPLVQQLEICQTCQEYLYYLTARRKLEKEDIHQLQTKEHAQKQQQQREDRKPEPFLLSIDWLQQWQRFIHCTNLDVTPPGPVDNTPLLQTEASEKKDFSLVEGSSFRKLSYATWNYFMCVYGGGPTVVTSLELAQKE